MNPVWRPLRPGWRPKEGWTYKAIDAKLEGFKACFESRIYTFESSNVGKDGMFNRASLDPKPFSNWGEKVSRTAAEILIRIWIWNNVNLFFEIYCITPKI